MSAPVGQPMLAQVLWVKVGVLPRILCVRGAGLPVVLPVRFIIGIYTEGPGAVPSAEKKNYFLFY